MAYIERQTIFKVPVHSKNEITILLGPNQSWYKKVPKVWNNIKTNRYIIRTKNNDETIWVEYEERLGVEIINFVNSKFDKTQNSELRISLNPLSVVEIKFSNFLTMWKKFKNIFRKMI